MEKKGILVVSFGTSYAHTRALTIEAIENAVRHAYPGMDVYRAWTSKRIVQKILMTTGEKIADVKEAMALMAKDGITHVYIQPTHVINGFENDQMREDALKFQEDFAQIRFGAPLISSTEDMLRMVKIISASFENMGADEALILMGHGSAHHANTVYAALDYMFKEAGHPNIYVGTVEAYPELSHVLPRLKGRGIKRIHLAPLMIVAGDHAVNDMASDEKDSWRIRCEKEGYQVICHLKGLGEYPQVRTLLLKHLKASMNP